MQISVPIYQRRLEGGWVEWTTLGLGESNRTVVSRSAGRARKELVDTLRKLVARLEPRQVRRFLAGGRGVRLTRVRLELALGRDRGRRRTTGLFPVVHDARWFNEDDRVVLAYHPARPRDWFPLPEGADLAESARIAWQAAWRDEEPTEVEELVSDGKDTIRTLAFDATPRSLMALLERDQGRRHASHGGGAASTLAEIAVDLTARLADEPGDLGLPRPALRTRLQQLLCGRVGKKPVLLVGPRGSGKSTLLRRWVHDLLLADDYPSHRNLDRLTHVWSLSGQRLIAGMQYAGDWEQRAVKLLAEVAKRRAILLAEDVGSFALLGRTRDSDRNLAEVLRAPLERGELVLVGELTAAQLQRLERDAPSFVARFAIVRVPEATPEETFAMMLHRVRHLERRHPVAFAPAAYQSVRELGGALLPGLTWPGKALGLLEELAGAVSGPPPDGGRHPIGPDEVVALLATKTGLPPELLLPKEPLDPARLRERFEQRVMGQDTAVGAAVDLVLRIRGGLTDARRPYGVYLLTGPTGTGKTELARAIASVLYGSEARLVRLDMSEYGAPGTASRLIGDRWLPRGALTQPVLDQPFSVVLLDEIDKADRSVLHLLLQLFDEGRLTDARGQAADFTHSVVVMTANLGGRAQAAAGFVEAEDAVRQDVRAAVADFFPPELLNRIDRVIPFEALRPDVARRIARKELRRLLGRPGLRRRRVFVDASERVLDRVVAEGCDPRYGARPLKRWLEDRVGGLLAEHLVSTPAAGLRLLRIHDTADGLRLHAEVLAEEELGALRWGLEPLHALPIAELAKHAAPAAARVDALTASAPFVACERHRARREGSAAYWTERYLTATAELRKDLDAIGGGKVSDRDHLVDRLSAVWRLERLVHVADEPREHEVVVELLAVGGRPLPPAGAGVPATGLLEALVEAYTAAAEEVEDAAVLAGDGRLSHGADRLASGLERRPTMVVLRLSGLGLRDRLAGDTGCHVWQSLGLGVRVVRVRVFAPRGDDGTAREHIEAHRRSREAFGRALDEGAEPLPPNPDALLPTVRTLSWDPPAVAGELAPIALEEPALGWAVETRARSLGELLPRVWALRASREEGTRGA